MYSNYNRLRCFFNITAKERLHLKVSQLNELAGVYRIYFGWMPLPVAIIAIVITIIYMKALLGAMRLKRVSRKCHVLILNRVMGDILCLLSSLTATTYCLVADHIRRQVITVIETFLLSSVWFGMVSYVSLCILKLYAVWRPLRYRQNITLKKCIYIALLSWFLFAALITYTLIVTAFIGVPKLQNWSGCQLETCFRVMHRFRNFAVVFVYTLTLGVFGVTALLVRRANHFNKLFHVKNVDTEGDFKSKFPLWKLALNVATFAILFLPYVAWAIAILTIRNYCLFFWKLPHLMRILGIIRFTLILRIVVDPIIAFKTEFQIRHGLPTWFISLSPCLGDPNHSVYREHANNSSIKSSDQISTSLTHRPTSFAIISDDDEK
ncbi:hypothetical protein AB6A40_000411 [Gnathostoma spinigerum]|uniref:G-protein coupled receptors family 1 profile domain-containing protein n=1 Tax=Gnathostoma spinigerum TaxID=75299 RepID=A0ABD6EB56_9BILA